MLRPDRIVEMASAFYESCVLFAASDLGIFAALAAVGRADAPALALAGLVLQVAPFFLPLGHTSPQPLKLLRVSLLLEILRPINHHREQHGVGCVRGAEVCHTRSRRFAHH